MSILQQKELLSDALIIFTKEMRNIFKDKRTVFSLFILPLFLIPVLFIGIESMSSLQQQKAEQTRYTLQILNNPDPRFTDIISQLLSWQAVETPGEDTLIIEFPETYTPGVPAEISIRYDSTSSASSYAARTITRAVEQYDDVLAALTLKASGLDLEVLYTLTPKLIDTAPPQAQGTQFLAMMLPYLILIYTFAGAMGVGMDTTAGEKERGSLAILLVNQVSRTSIALGKVLFALSVGIISSFMTFAGMLIAFSVTGGFFSEQTQFSGFSIPSLLTLLITLMCTSMLAASLIVLLGSLAKSVKEAAGYITPVYIIVVVMGVLTMNLDAATQPLLFLIPFANSVFLMKSAIIGDVSALPLVLTVGSLSLIIAVLITLTSRLYNSEKILEGAAS